MRPSRKAKVQSPKCVHGISGHSNYQLHLRTPSDQLPSTNSERPPEPSLPSSSSFSSSSSASLTVFTFTAVASATHINISHDPDTPTNTNITTVDTDGEDPVYTCPHCDRTFT
nr:unnamed protein product [Spirometra erinaceieuropaei]